MNRIFEAAELRKQGFSINDIAEKMGISKRTVSCYLYLAKDKKLELIINKELKRFNLPLEWSNEALKLTKTYKSTHKFQGIPHSTPVRAILQLLCRKYRVPTPIDLRRLTVKYTRLTTGGREHCYITVLKELDGVVLAKPSEYIKNFFSKHPSYRNELQDMALKISKSLPRLFIQGKNPRVLASACIYAVSKGILTQREITDFFQVSAPALRYTLRKLEKLRLRR